MKILVATDGQPWSERALKRVADLTPEQRREVLVLAVQPPGPAIREVDLALARACEILGREGIVPRTLRRQGDPGEEIAELAGSESVDMIVVGTHQRDALTRAMIGSVSRGLAQRAHIPVLIVP
jgi:nucleotide-binding universal stress UspA family protein